MRFSLFTFQWKIHWIPLVIFIAVFSLLLRLGFWQLSRADEKELFLATQSLRLMEKPVSLTELLKKPTEYRYRPVLLEGKYDSKHQLLVDNQIYMGKVGAFVMTPFIISNSARVVLVNRGWVATDKARKLLPDISMPENSAEVSLVGIVNEFPSVGLILKGADVASDGWPSVVQIVNTDKLTKKFEYLFYPFQVQLKADQANGYIRDWKINTRMPLEKHRAYAFQWFALATTLFFLTLWISCKTHKND
ncbi:Cytochrome oxidase biogenesis protein Surf1, facilitates heme A insertion [Bathymodiolus brooksi thiotrophic gill symbiont]|nr:Cytochrome oxidase biogenesis protein Surf1, facilitates heme A insertion [Bathymodiolus brooksi thiotrophic gill symbiont]